MAHSALREFIATQPFFAGLGVADLQFLADHAMERWLPSGEALFRLGEPSTRFFLLRSGQVRVEIPALWGPSLRIQTLGPGQVLGWSWLISPYRWSFQAVAERDSAVIAFDGERILARCEEDPRFGYQLLKRFAELMSERLEAARRRMMDAWNPPGFA